MIRAWRIDKAKRSKADSFSGDGARLYPGRWNGRDHPAVYAASSLSLAALEKFIHMGQDGAKIAFVSYAIEIPDSVRTVAWELSDLPADWRDQPAPASTRAKGDRRLSGLSSAVLILPSVVLPSERNILLNPEHPEFKSIKISAPAPFSFNPRMWKS